jgi:hypothetical protein
MNITDDPITTLQILLARVEPACDPIVFTQDRDWALQQLLDLSK